MKGALSPNERLLAVEHLHEGDVIAPEAFAEGELVGIIFPYHDPQTVMASRGGGLSWFAVDGLCIFLKGIWLAGG